MNFNAVDLRLFIAIAQKSSITHGAEARHLSLAAASARVKALEDAAGVPLLIRKARGVKLTPAGEAFLHHARAILRQTEALRAELNEYSRGLRGHVRVHANTTAFTDILPQVLPGFLKTHPRVNVELQERQNAEILIDVLDCSADLGIVSARVDAPGIRSIHFSTDRLVLVVPRSHRFARRKQIAFADTLDEDFVGMHPSSTLTEFLASITAGTGKPMRIRVQLSNFDAVCRMIGTGVGIGIVPASSARRNLVDMPLVQVELKDAWRVRERFVISREGEPLPAFAQALVDALIAFHADRSLEIKV
ncbi:LysR family transcriptional regulator [Hydrogenophaga sp. 2FB]|uniref:LysR family transcriptional regulator n=1 Tax=Hydrogenophaga sp. 2FB TaxID=2502187 RepID=UPI0010F59CEF|nr:LysR family transcriptional regulator [Hydrogenophaga sp. 2FB]